MAPNLYIGQPAGRFSERRNWSNNDNNWNCECVINNTTDDALVVVHDMADPQLGKIGRLTLVNATLLLTNRDDDIGVRMIFGPVSLYGTSVIRVSAGWVVTSEKVSVNDSSELVISQGAVWDHGSERLTVQNAGSVNLASAVVNEFKRSVIASGTFYAEGDQTVGEAPTAVDLGDVTYPHWSFWNNCDPVNSIRVRNGLNGADVAELFPGESAFIPLVSSCLPHVVASGASTRFEYMVVNLGPPADPDAEPPVIVAPATPANLRVTFDNHIAILTWDASVGATSYKLWRGTTAGGQGGTAYVEGISNVGYADTLTTGQSFYYKVSALNAAGESAKSNEVYASDPVTAPDAPTNLQASFVLGEVALTWTASSGATSYRLYKALSSNGQGSTPHHTNIVTTSDTDTGAFGYYKVTAVNSAGESAKSNEAYAT